MPEHATAGPDTSPKRGRRFLRLSALRISGIYLVCSLLWIAFSDRILLQISHGVSDPGRFVTTVQTIKGWFFVSTSSLVLYFLIQTFTRSIERTKDTSLRAAERYEVMFQRSPLAMWVYDSATLKFLAVNDSALKVYGYSREEFLSMKITELRNADQVARLMAYLPTISSQTATAGVWQHRRKDGSELGVEVVSREIRFDDCDARLVLALDVTQKIKTEQALEDYRTQLEQRVAARTADLSTANQQLQEQIAHRQSIEVELRAAKRAAEEANMAKSAFLANTTHEIRTPLTSILGYTDLLVDRNLTPDDRERYVMIARQNAAHLLKLIEDLLDLSRIETGNLRVAVEEVDPLEIAKESLELLRPRSVEKKLGLRIEVIGTIPTPVRTDGARLRQVLLNLLTNAIKFTRTGEVVLIVRSNGAAAQESGGGSHWVRFEVVDSGIGIEEKHLARIFEAFYQVEAGQNQRNTGTGLGLSISRRLTEQMGGTLKVSSTVGKGSTFTVQIPVEAPSPAAVPSGVLSSAPSVLRGRILLAEDNANIRALVEEYLRRAGATVVGVADGASAVQVIAATLKDGAPIDLVLMDISMPGMDGPQALMQMRVAGYRGPIVALTAHALSEDQTSWAGAGWTAIAAKPIDQRTFLPLLARLLGEGNEGSAS